MKFLVPCLLTAALLVLSIQARADAHNPKANLLMDLTMNQPLGTQIPLDVAVTGEDGVQRRLGDYFGKRPVIFTFVYHECPMLCGQVYIGLSKALKPLKLRMGQDFDWLTLSINPNDTPASAQAKMKELNWPQAHFLVAGKSSIDTLTTALGYKFARDDESKEYAHPSGFYVFTPEGKLSRLFYGVEFSARDLRLSLLEAGQGRIGSLVDKLLLFCYHYDPKVGRYGVAIYRVLQLASFATVAGLGTWVGVMIHTHRRVR